MFTAKLIGCGTNQKFKGVTTEEVTEKIANYLQQRYDETSDDAWLETDAVWIGSGRVFNVDIEISNAD